jgi:hypothetical protein
MDRFVIKIVPSEPGGTSVTGSSTLSADASNQPSAASMNPSTSSDSSHTAKTVKGRQYVPEWKKVFPWIIYDTSRNKVFCDICTTASKSRVVLLTSPYDQLTHSAFVRDGFSQWTKGRERLATHEGSNYHHAAVEGLAAMKKGVNVAASCSVGKTKQMTDARSALIKILSSVQFLCKQGLAIRGHVDEDSNLTQLLMLRSGDAPDLKAWLARTSYRWTSHDISNEIIEIMAHKVLRKVMEDVHRFQYFTIMLDETADISVKEQVSICFRFVSDDFDIHEVFVGFYSTDSTTSTSLLAMVKDVLTRFDLPLDKCRGQCYDGASNVAGIRRGLQALILQQEPRALYVHCLAHTLNLAVQDTVQDITICRNFLSFVGDLISFVRSSPKRLAWFEKMNAEEGKVKRNLL